jgi:predicted 3-demethylubiquinone-9 3-methyltransferase (glyoxalase superfamily)
MSATFELDGLTPAASMMVVCETQEEIDRIWNGLAQDGTESECGWLIDPFGLSWQVIPSLLPKLTGDPDREKAGRAIQAMFKMKKIDIATLERAFAGA